MSKKKQRGDFLKKILTEDEVYMTTKFFQDWFSSQFPDNQWFEHISTEKIVRMMSLNHHVKEKRESKGLSIKEVASQLKVPQYRLKAIEEGTDRGSKPDIFWKYIEFLGLTDFVNEWIAANKKLAQDLGFSTENK